MKAKMNNNDVYYDELISLITGTTNISSQYVIFQNCDDEYYAINVAKVEELIQNKNIEMIKSTNGDILTLGVSKIRDHLSVLVKFDDWIGVPIKPSDKLSLIILCKYSSTRLGLLVKNVVGIQSIELDDMFNGTQRDEKVAYSAQISVNGKKKVCNIFDFDQLTMDLYPNILIMNQNLVEELQIQINTVTTKIVLIAEDSMLMQTQIKSLLDKMNLTYHMYDNGLSLFEALQEIPLDDIGLIITDIEMPVMDGLELIQEIHKAKIYDNIPLLAHTNMANSVISKSLFDYGVLAIVDKLDLGKLKENIIKYAKD